MIESLRQLINCKNPIQSNDLFTNWTVMDVIQFIWTILWYFFVILKLNILIHLY